ncbi:hypothetical protein [Sulfitobacter sp. R18_1]|uniref:hypothetical protein n=1 Tax=Sulfitobacter sp. R18_1 TaxID=2821104 RepID=UPI001ADBE030|nr:hypothetical protein [Sulfitobacter sp. R18_1]MBO9428278.1 hypothetical protein [Sulfitobacter sp. R18_1]
MTKPENQWNDLLTLHEKFSKANEGLRQALSRVDVLVDQGVKGDALTKAISECRASAFDQKTANDAVHEQLESVLAELSLAGNDLDIMWEPHDDGGEGDFVSKCQRFEVSMDPVYGYLKLHHFGDPTESLAEGGSLRAMTDAAIDVIKRGDQNPGFSGP